MTAKEYLGQAYRIDKDINDMLDEVATLRSMATKTTSIITDMPRSATKKTSGLADTVIKLMEREEVLDHEIDRLVDLRAEICDAIKCIDDWEERKVLYLRYIGYRDWTEISESMHIGLRQVYRLHGNALKKIIVPSPKDVSKCQ